MLILDRVKNETTAYAKEELSSYLIKMANISNRARIDLELIDASTDIKMSDDRYIIEITDGVGFIKGSNSRSILLGVYAYLKHLGCRFLRPGPLGEIVPKSNLSGTCSIDFKAFYPYRVEIIEGAVDEVISKEVIKWLPKAGYNGYYIQYVTPYVFLKRWYLRELNPYKQPEEFSYDDATEVIASIENFAAKLGLQLWEIGHGFMFYPFGMNYGPDWTNRLSEEAKPYVALTNGKREIHGGSINYTNLCYTEPVVRKKMAEFFVDYMHKHPHCDVIDISLADGMRNNCTCERCMKKSVSDIYADMLNDIDAALTENNIDVKIKLSVYVDTRWAPESVKLKNPDRYINSVAAMRKYGQTYITKKFDGELPPNDRTKFQSFEGFEYSLRFMDDWQKQGDFPRVIWDYHLYASHYYDIASYMDYAVFMAEDAKNLRKINSGGILNCKTQRSFMPTSLPVYCFGEMLLNPDSDYEKVKDDYFGSAFGGLAKETERYLTKMGELIPAELMIVKTEVANDGGTTADKRSIRLWKNNEAAAKLFAEVPNTVDSFMKTVEEYLKTEENDAVRRSFELLCYHGEIMKRFAKALWLGAVGQPYESEVDELKAYIMQNEDNYILEFDAYLFIRRFLNEVVFKG